MQNTTNLKISLKSKTDVENAAQDLTTSIQSAIYKLSYPYTPRNMKRPRGRPRQRWLDAVRRDIEELKPDWNGNLDLAYARDVWGKLVLEAKSLNGS
ncbi:hypothetical protein ACI65C_011335 [Semiaphis heraclei]